VCECGWIGWPLGGFEMSIQDSFFSMWLTHNGNAAGLYKTPYNCAAIMELRQCFATYNGLCDSLDSCAL
jgi:hypothetical protein